MQTPELIAHRGASRERPENSLTAFRRGLELGADAIELDLHRTSDDVIVVHHDPILPDGRLIRQTSSVELQVIRIRGEAVPTLEQVFQDVGASLRLYCELKGTGTTPGTMAVIGRAASSNDRAAVHAFDHRLVGEAARIAPEVPRGVLEVSYPVDCLGAARAVSARDLWRHWEHVDADLVEAAHAGGCRVIAWTVNDAALMTRLAAWGVDGLCTDDVALARATFR